MHYCLMLFTKEFPTEEIIENMMQKIQIENIGEMKEDNGYPRFTCTWYNIGGRYNGSIKLKIDTKDEIYGWQYYQKVPRNGRLFWSYLLSQMEKFSDKSFMYLEEDYFSSMGANDGFLYVDGAKISDIINFDTLDCYVFMEADGSVYSKERWDKKDFILNNDFRERLQAAKDKAKKENQFVTLIDCHD